MFGACPLPLLVLQMSRCLACNIELDSLCRNVIWFIKTMGSLQQLHFFPISRTVTMHLLRLN
ncbi:hypothetical protein DUNSADRAFT_2073 [Dunaliella salina]|uniref:Uncharacterized protein n=1 Tax=Dunaliella salina TaxID=3046 RepID=A0ABQ7FWM5_DUNSA|nr:hypothetical protein DUNSADRAFT_2073 [Dunaliella salina]|eukprot:KAF5826773.1 hypothetical protein DUNSADRAFT_2073 [Dunaliella salina]